MLHVIRNILEVRFRVYFELHYARCLHYVNLLVLDKEKFKSNQVSGLSYFYRMSTHR